jgi:hypothetical protein
MASPKNKDPETEFASLAFTSSTIEASRSGILLRAVDIEPKTITTYRGDVVLQEAWIETRLHKVPAETTSNPDRLVLPASGAKPNFYLCVRHRAQSAEEATFGGIWFTKGVQWTGFSQANYEIKRCQLADGAESDVPLVIISITDLEMRGGNASPAPGKGLAQMLHLKDKLPNQSTDPTP